MTCLSQGECEHEVFFFSNQPLAAPEIVKTCEENRLMDFSLVLLSKIQAFLSCNSKSLEKTCYEI